MPLSNIAKKYLWNIAPALYRRLGNANPAAEFSIGMLSGNIATSLNQCCPEPVLVLSRKSVTDVPAAFVADPFIIKHDGLWYMFFEIMNQIDYMGCIGYATSRDGSQWNYGSVVLKEPFHLAYPHVFTHNNSIYMVPDSIGNGVRLYRAERFPDQWTLEKTLINDENLCDATLFFHEGRWWTLCCDRRNGQDALRIYYADQLHGPWQEHSAGAICEPIDQRPAGRVITFNGKLHRFVQNHEGNYAEFVRARCIEKLTPTEFVESTDTRLPLLHGSGNGWNADGMHHIDVCISDEQTFIASVDGLRRN